ncbi:nudix hydrolase 8-like [Olea europaea subsp. europaea]|uniref:Nudix hydrolase 8-like n=1 Tax=Olea europaea subsp. europaea TaxID=158383 RepID=A0A8S0T7V0_OLEEU|nr:nudix hydrolase 8-like [Olea europaea subsp. europaea]
MASKVSIYQFPGSFGPKVSLSKNDTAIGFSKSIKSKQFFAKTPDFKLGFSPKQEVEVLSTKIMAPELQVELLNAWNDDYNGVVIEPTSLPSSANAFASVLKASLSTWKYKGKRGIWLKLLEEQADLVPIAIKEGFVYHHAEPAYVMLTYWIPNEPCVLPLGPSHQIGIAGFVINDNKEILVVKEKCSCSCYGVWKLPTGYINKSEELFSGAVREVKEETGIDTAFLELVAFRHVHQVAFEKSDLLFVCMLKPLSFIIKIDENEIQDATWITLDKLISQQFYEEDQMSKRVIEVCMATYENRYSGFISHQLTSKFDGKLSYLYHNNVNPI